MALTSEGKKQAIEANRRHETDTGSPQVQVAILTGRINDLTEHQRRYRHDYASRRGAAAGCAFAIVPDQAPSRNTVSRLRTRTAARGVVVTPDQASLAHGRLICCAGSQSLSI